MCIQIANSCWSDRLWWPSIGNQQNVLDVKLWNKYMQESFTCDHMWVSYVTIWDLHLRRQLSYLGCEILEVWIRTQGRHHTPRLIRIVMMNNTWLKEGSFYKLTAPIIPWLRSSVLGANVRMYGVEPEEGNKICLTIKCTTSCNSAIMKGSGSHKGCLIDTHTVL